MLLKPTADGAQGFRKEWIPKCFAEREPSTQNLNIYAFVDPATSKSRKADFTPIAIIGLARGNHYVVLDVVRDRLNLYERTDCVWQLHRQWRPRIWFYERYGMQADQQHLEYTKHERNDRTLRLEEVGRHQPKRPHQKATANL